MEYPKTENLYASNGAQDSTRASGPEFGFRQEAVGQISKWLVTEKVDGMNMRVLYQPNWPKAPMIQFFGRTDRANIPGDLRTHMEQTFTPTALSVAFDTSDPLDPEPLLPDEVILFGEGFGPGIQKAGQAYGGVKRFILFDVVVNGVWLSFANVQDIAQKLGIESVPVLCEACDLETAKLSVGHSLLQAPDSEHIEGIVARTDPYLFDGRGKRVMFKYKLRDL